MPSEPFRRGPFEDLPELPRRPHPYFAEPLRTVAVTTPELGTLQAAVRVHGSGPPLCSCTGS